MLRYEYGDSYVRVRLSAANEDRLIGIFTDQKIP